LGNDTNDGDGDEGDDGDVGESAIGSVHKLFLRPMN
jgi:hypothetical protein